jgi:hypothetical protein
MAQFPRTVYCHLHAVLMAFRVTCQRTALDRKDVHVGKFSNTLFNVCNEKCAIYVLHHVKSKAQGLRKIVEDSGMRHSLFNKILVLWSSTCGITVLFVCVKTYANRAQTEVAK